MKALGVYWTQAQKYKNQEMKFDWFWILDGNHWLRRAGLTKREINNVDLWVMVDDSHIGSGWLVHADQVLGDKCPRCCRGDRYQRKAAREMMLGVISCY